MTITCGVCGHSGEDGTTYNHDCYWVFRKPMRETMTKREAYARLDMGDLTWGHLKHFIAQCYDQERNVLSVVNPGITRGQSLDILSATVEPNEDNELIVSPLFTASRNAKASLIAVNVLRETHFR